MIRRDMPEVLAIDAGEEAVNEIAPHVTHALQLDASDEIYPGHRWHAVMQTIVAAARGSSSIWYDCIIMRR